MINNNENIKTQLSSISQAQTLEEIGEFWDAHSLDDYWDQTYEIKFKVRAKSNHKSIKELKSDGKRI